MSEPVNSTYTCPIVAFTAGKGGCGKTTLSVNFAYNLYKAGKKVLLVDFDLANRGSTGLFASIVNRRPAGTVLSLTDLLEKSDEKSMNPDKLPAEIRPGYYFLPATPSGANVNLKKYESVPLETLVKNTRDKLLQLAFKSGVDCIVLDCFCGIDILTTLAVCVSEDAIFINEPDIVTFTGTIYLKRHIQAQLDSLPKDFPRPDLHLVINRLRSEFSVVQLNEIYQDNLLQEFPKGAECHFLYNERIFRNFGRYAFWEDLLPHSLFVKKMDLLCWQLFKDTDHEDFLKEDVANWSQADAARIYIKSKDYNSIDSQTLVLQLTDLVMYGGLLAALYYIGVYLTPLNEQMAAVLFLSLAMLCIVAYITNLVWPTILITRLNYSIAIFQYRLKKRTGKLNSVEATPIYFRFLRTGVMALSTMIIVFLLIKTVYNFRKELGLNETLHRTTAANPFSYLANTTIPSLALSNSGRFGHMNFTNSKIEGINFTDSNFNFLYKKNFKNTDFEYCTFFMDSLVHTNTLKNAQINYSLIIFSSNFEYNYGSRFLSLFTHVIPNHDAVDLFTHFNAAKPDSLTGPLAKMDLLTNLDTMASTQKLFHYVVIDKHADRAFNWKTNRFISTNDFTKYPRDTGSSKTIIFLNDSISKLNYNFDPDKRVIFWNCHFDNSKTEVFNYLRAHPNVICFRSLSDRDSSFNRGVKYTAEFLLRSLMREISEMPPVQSPEEPLSDRIEASILVGEPGMGKNIAYELQKLSRSKADPYARKRALFLDLLYKTTFNFPKGDLRKALQRWEHYCSYENKMLTNLYDTWIWDDWDKYSRITLNLTPQQAEFIADIKATEQDKFHNDNTPERKIISATHFAKLNADFDKL